jgi:glyoxylase-like metal-dependent hydrolase (beta-lactamase superfamily II)
MEPIIHSIFEAKTCSWQYVVACPKVKEAVIIDPVLNFEPSLFRITTESADNLLDCILKCGYTVKMLLETHAHGGHLSASYYLQQALWSRGQPHAQICISENITVVQSYFAHKYRIPKEEIDHAFNHLFQPDEVFHLGEVRCTALHLPGHTPDHMGYKIGSNVFTGDSFFNPDVGSGRCDFPGGNARQMFRSIQRLLSFPPVTRLYIGHDYLPYSESTGRDPMPYVTVGEQQEKNKHAKNILTEEDFVQWRNDRDKVIPEPRLVHQSLQVNVRGGKMPSKSHDGKAYMLYLIEVPSVLLS